MGTDLVIVESPAKAKTIGRILGPRYSVLSSVGHVRDLPQRRIGVNLEQDFEPQYEIVKGKQKLIESLRKVSDQAALIYLAPDPDREGEAIAWHLKALLARDPSDERFLRVRYNEITPRAVRDAFEHPGQIEQPRVDAQQARRVLDRIVGYRVSPLLWSQVQRGLSAGRVQSVALRMVVERERKIQAFTPETYWIMGARVRKLSPPPDPFVMRLSKLDGKPASIQDAETADNLLRELDGCGLRVCDVRVRPVTKRPPPPFITSTLQQAASNAHGFSPGRTMMLAQRLYEGVEMGDGPVGLITYMRTDSVNISAEAATAARAYIGEVFGEKYVPESRNVFRNRTGAQGAHEAIRPTDVSRGPDTLAGLLEPAALKLYATIWRRYVASQMAPARLSQRTVEAVPEDGLARDRYRFSVTVSEIVFDGFLKVDPSLSKSSVSAEDGDVVDRLPPLARGEALECLEWLSDRKETKPPPRFSEASLVRAMEAKGIGRPSTYAGIVETLGQRKYVQRLKRMLHPTELGMEVGELLARKLDALFDVGFTAGMESALDRIENGEITWTAMLREFYDQFQQWMAAAREPAADAARVNEVLNLLGRVREWAPEYQQGRRLYGDRRFVESIETQCRERKKPVSARQYEALLRLLCRYRKQVPEADAWLRQQGREDLFEASELLPPRETTPKKLARIQQAPLADRDRAFADSLARQVEGGRRLSEAQLRVLDQLVAGVIGRNGAETERQCAALGIDPALCEVDRESERWIEALQGVQQWREPTQRGKRVFDDKAFVESLQDQFQRRGTLSPKQRAALRRTAMRYKDQIPGFDALIRASENAAAPSAGDVSEPDVAP